MFVEERDFVRVGHCDFTLASFALEVTNRHEPGPLLIKGWLQCLHSSVRSMGRSRVESDIALLPRRAGARGCLSAIGAGDRTSDDIYPYS